MKKLIAVLIALAMVLSMSVMSFASWSNDGGTTTIGSPGDIQATYNTDGANTPEEFWNKSISLEEWQISDYDSWWTFIEANNTIKKAGIYTKSDDTLMSWDEAWSAYYALVLSGVTSDPSGAVTEIVSTVQNGYVEAGDAIKMVGEAAMGGAGGDGGAGDMSGVIDQIIGAIGGGGEEAQPEISTEAYVEELKELINSGADFETISTKISEDIASGKIVVSQLPDIAKGLTDLIDAGQIENNETVQKVLEFINGFGGEGEGVTFPDFGGITLPGDEGNSESGSFLDTILGIIGSIGDIFNPDAGDEPTPDEPTTDDGFVGDATTIPDTGDVSFVAVAAVAAVAGVALVLTRKKNDAE